MSSAPDLARHAWPLARLAEALDVLARRAGLDPGYDAALDAACEPTLVRQDLPRWIAALANAAGVETEQVSATRDRLAEMLGAAAPALVRIELAGEPMLLLLVAGGRRHARLLGPDLVARRVPVATLADALNHASRTAIDVDLAPLLARAGLTAAATRRAARALSDERLAEQRFADCWLLRAPAGSGWRVRLAEARLPALTAVLLVVFAALYGAEIGGWALLGRGALDGQFQHAWLGAWTLLLFSLVPLEVAARALEARLALGAGRAIKTRVLEGALALPPDAVRAEGAGHLLARVLETQTFESLLLSGGFGAALAVLELLGAAWVLAQTPHGIAPLVALGGMLLVVAACALRYARELAHWTASRFALTHDLTERLTGHRTRQAQEPAGRRHRDEDQLLDEYHDRARRFDRIALPLFGALPRMWLVLGLAALAPALLASDATPLALGIAIGGVLLAHRALATLLGGLASLLRARLAWSQVRCFLVVDDDGRRAQPLLPKVGGAPGEKLLELRDVAYRYRADGAAALEACDLVLRRGERVLIEGPSGGGKSTLAALMAGWRRPSRGLLLLRGLDRGTLGATWRRLATAAPQFHENHVLSGTLAFNLLMGREWPPSEATLAEAEDVCRALGLGPLLERMPSGLMQMVGETGWQLSHGERSRVFLARALLQRADLVVLDESFAALDPPTLAECLRYAMLKAPTLAVIAHP